MSLCSAVDNSEIYMYIYTTTPEHNHSLWDRTTACFDHSGRTSIKIRHWNDKKLNILKMEGEAKEKREKGRDGTLNLLYIKSDTNRAKFRCIPNISLKTTKPYFLPFKLARFYNLIQQSKWSLKKRDVCSHLNFLNPDEKSWCEQLN